MVTFLALAARLRAFAHDRRGVTALEYGLIAALVAAAVITGVTALGSGLSTTFTSIAKHV